MLNSYATYLRLVYDLRYETRSPTRRRLLRVADRCRALYLEFTNASMATSRRFRDRAGTATAATPPDPGLIIDVSADEPDELQPLGEVGTLVEKRRHLARRPLRGLRRRRVPTGYPAARARRWASPGSRSAAASGCSAASTASPATTSAEIEIVTPTDGQLLRCNEESHADLFWACRGGGGGRNFPASSTTSSALRPIRSPSSRSIRSIGPWSRATANCARRVAAMDGGGSGRSCGRTASSLSAGSAGRRSGAQASSSSSVAQLQGDLNGICRGGRSTG